MKRKTFHKIGGYGLLLVAVALLVGPTLILVKLRQPQYATLRMVDDAPVLMSAPVSE